MKWFVATTVVSAALLAACRPTGADPHNAITCRSFSFQAKGKAEITEARKQFYEAAMLYGADFSDGIRWGGPAVFFPGRGRFVLNYGDGSYLRTDPDPTLQLTVTWFDEADDRGDVRATPCSAPGTEETYAKVRASFSKRWHIAAAAPACVAPGEPIQWIADYCMLKMETDDEIAVSGCIEEGRRTAFPDACSSNTHFKRRMCEQMIRDGTKTGTADQCVNDATFMGRTVEAGGVGGGD